MLQMGVKITHKIVYMVYGWPVTSEIFFFRHGKTVAKYPQIFIPICLTIPGLLAIGILNYSPEANPFKLWIPPDSDFVQNTNWLWKNFPPDTR